MTHFESDRAGLKLIVAYKLVKAALGALLAAVLLHEHLHGRIVTMADRVGLWFAHTDWLARMGPEVAAWISRELTSRNVNLAIGLIALDAVSTTLEGVGLHFRQRWAAWLVVLATSCLIPLEIWGLVAHVTVLRAAILAINVAIVAYLVRQVLVGQRRSAAA